MSDLETASDLARLGGARLLEDVGRPRHVRSKSLRTDVVTATDRAIQETIVRRIRVMHPDDGILAEEDGETLAGTSGRRWVIDPLDGTSNFVRGLWPAVVSVGLERGGELSAGAVYDPVQDELFAAEIGSGAYCNGIKLDRSHDAVELRDAYVGISGAEARGPDTMRVKAFSRFAVEADSVRDLGSTALQLCYVAHGRLDAQLVFAVRPWDAAAGFVIAREAGCVVEGDYEKALVAPPRLASIVRSRAPDIYE